MPIPEHIARLLNEKFDKIFVVTVPRFTERHTQVREKLKGLPFDFFWGIDKQQLNMEELKEEGCYDENAARKNQRQGKPLNLGEIACALSHRNVYAEMIKWGWERVLILEDDVVPLYSHLSFFESTINELPLNWELVYFGYLKHEKVTFYLKTKQFFYKLLSTIGLMKWSYTMVNNLLPKNYSTYLKKAGFHDCTHAYAVSLSGAKKLLAAQTPVAYRADDLLSVATLKGEIHSFVSRYKFFDQESFYDSSQVSEVRPEAKGLKTA